MTNDAPKRKLLTPTGGLPSGNWPKRELIEYIRADIAHAEKKAAVVSAANAAMAAAYDMCVKLIESLFPDNSDDDIVCRVAADSIRSLSKVSRDRADTDPLEAVRQEARAEARRVKPLEWHKSHVSGWNEDWHTVPTGYTVRCADENGWKWSTPLGSFGYELSPAAAKAAAQADYERRILSALIPDTDKGDG